MRPNTDTPLNVAARMMPSEAYIPFREDASSVGWDIPLSPTDSTSHAFYCFIGGNQLFKISANGDGAGGISSPEMKISAPVTMDYSLDVNQASTFENGLTVKGDLFNISGTFYLLGNIYGGAGGTFYGVYFFESPGGVQFDAPVYHTGVTQFDNNVLIGGAAGTGANKVLALNNSATPPADSTDVAQLFAKDIAAGRATLAVVTEESVAVDAALVSTHSLIVWLNLSGTLTKFKVPLILA